MITNHHAHTRFSDGIGEPYEYVKQALQQGVSAYAFSDHAPIPLDGIGSMPVSILEEYSSTIAGLQEEFSGRIQLYKSLEVDYLPGLMSVESPHIVAAELDFTVGAVHYVDRLPDGTPWSFQRPEPVFGEGIRTIFGNDARKMVERYYGLVREMVTMHPPHIVAHLDRIKKRNVRQTYWDEGADWYIRAVEETLEAIQGAGCILEVNTRGLYLGEWEDTYPSAWIVERAHRRGIRLQVNSDAHRSEHITGGFARAYRILQDAGAEAVWIYNGENFTAIPLPGWD
ncbi:histidinol-phosphatase [Neolewinella litorea]|uniref:Histidinol-phosphatase n=1 Tax=Neolewinella litorea TaxID=2562452 RepID=A0A4S4N955_9BACT|nr:histidinol-phosphatase [Neolewinella litorea]THH34897.1 histidinol-phosphatase HisJ family protein [Neolewinella litorea]